MAMREVRKSELVMFQEVWRRAFRQGEFIIPFPTEGSAQRARMQLYNAVAKAKAGKEFDDFELVQAAEKLEIVWHNAERTALRLQLKSNNDMTKGILEALGAKSVEEFVDPAMLESSEKLLKELKHEAPVEHKENPFYGKRDPEGLE